MDRTSREVLEQAAKEYYTDLKKSKYDADDSVQGRTSQNRYFCWTINAGSLGLPDQCDG